MNDVFSPGSPAVVADLDGETVSADIAIIGSGMGGATLAWALRTSGARILLVERGDFLPQEAENWSPVEVFGRSRYKNAEHWRDGRSGESFLPGVHYYVGGNTKVFGACLPRFREDDFTAVEHRDGVSPAWPISYAEMEPHYTAAERLYRVHGERNGSDPTEPWRSSAFPYPPLPHEPAVAELAGMLARQGLHPVALPMGTDIRPGGRCVRCRTCDGFPCRVNAKSDADVCAVRPALESRTVRLLTRTTVSTLKTSGDSRRVCEAVAVRDGRKVRIRAGRFVVSCGAANSAALLLRSASDAHPQGLGNSSDLVGRNYMVHNLTFLVAIDPRRRNAARFQKTIGMNDWYTRGADTPYPLGNVQMLGKLQGSMIKSVRPWAPMPALEYLTGHSVDVLLTTEDLPDPANRVTVDSAGQISVHWKPNNVGAHRELAKRMARAVRRAGFPFVFTERMQIETNSHQCGTAVMGDDPARSVLNRNCKAHDLDNVWVVDSSCFPSSAALNPALTIAANAMRVATTGELTA